MRALPRVIMGWLVMGGATVVVEPIGGEKAESGMPMAGWADEEMEQREGANQSLRQLAKVTKIYWMG